MRKPFVMVAPTGARRGKGEHGALPMCIEEIVATARDCFAAGARGLHLHIRDEHGAHSLDAGLYREALAELSGALPQMRVQITTEAAGVYSVAEQLACLQQVKPAWASVAVREVARDAGLAARLYGTCADNGTEVQHILYGERDVRLLAGWARRGILGGGEGGALRVLLVLGRNIMAKGGDAAAASPQERDVRAFLASLAVVPAVAGWMLCAFGAREHELLCAAAVLGGDVRVGFENSLVDGNGMPHADNAASVRALIRALETIGCSIGQED